MVVRKLSQKMPVDVPLLIGRCTIAADLALDYIRLYSVKLKLLLTRKIGKITCILCGGVANSHLLTFPGYDDHVGPPDNFVVYEFTSLILLCNNICRPLAVSCISNTVSTGTFPPVYHRNVDLSDSYIVDTSAGVSHKYVVYHRKFDLSDFIYYGHFRRCATEILTSMISYIMDTSTGLSHKYVVIHRNIDLNDFLYYGHFRRSIT